MISAILIVCALSASASPSVTSAPMELAPAIETLAKRGGDAEYKRLEVMWLALGDLDRAWTVGQRLEHGGDGLKYLTNVGRCDDAASYAKRALKQLGAFRFGPRTRDFQVYCYRWELLHFLDGCLKQLDKRTVASLVAAVPKAKYLTSSKSVDWLARLHLAAGDNEAAKALLARYLGEIDTGPGHQDAWLATAIEVSIIIGDREGAKKLLSKASREWAKRRGSKGFEAPSTNYLHCTNCGSTVMARLARSASQLGLRTAPSLWAKAVRTARRFKDPEARLNALGAVARLAVEAGEKSRARTLLSKHMPRAAAAFDRHPKEKYRVYDDPATDFVMAAAALGDRKLAMSAWRATPKFVPQRFANVALARLLASKPEHPALAKVVPKAGAQALFAASLVMSAAKPNAKGCKRLGRLWQQSPVLETYTSADKQRQALWQLLAACPKQFEALATRFRTQKDSDDLEYLVEYVWAFGAAMTGMRGDFEAAFDGLAKVSNSRQRFFALLVMLNPRLKQPLSTRAKASLAKLLAMKD